LVFDVGSTVVLIALAGVIVWQNHARVVETPAVRPRLSEDPLPTTPISIATNATLGSASARVAIIEYSDFECPACGAFARDLKPTLIREYVDKGQVAFVFKHFPLPIHSRAQSAAEAAWCAGQQGKFWDVHDRFFASAKAGLQESVLQAVASDVGLDAAAYNSCRAGDETSKRVLADRDEGRSANVNVRATPTFYFGKIGSDRRVQATDVMVGARSIGAFRAILDRLLK